MLSALQDLCGRGWGPKVLNRLLTAREARARLWVDRRALRCGHCFLRVLAGIVMDCAYKFWKCSRRVISRGRIQSQTHEGVQRRARPAAVGIVAL